MDKEKEKRLDGERAKAYRKFRHHETGLGFADMRVYSPHKVDVVYKPVQAGYFEGFLKGALVGSSFTAAVTVLLVRYFS